MNKADLILKIQSQLGEEETSKAHAAAALEAVLSSITMGLKKNSTVQIVGFGTFRISKLPARDGINPQTKEKIRIKASKSVKFKAGSTLKAAV